MTRLARVCTSFAPFVRTDARRASRAATLDSRFENRIRLVVLCPAIRGPYNVSSVAVVTKKEVWTDFENIPFSNLGPHLPLQLLDSQSTLLDSRGDRGSLSTER